MSYQNTTIERIVDTNGFPSDFDLSKVVSCLYKDDQLQPTQNSMLTLQQKFFEEKYLNLFVQQTTNQSTEKKSQLMQLFLRTNAQIVEEW